MLADECIYLLCVLICSVRTRVVVFFFVVSRTWTTAPVSLCLFFKFIKSDA